MVNTNTKEFRAKVQAHIRTQLKGNGGLSGLVDQIDYMKKGGRRTTESVAEQLLDAGFFLIYNIDIERQLHRWGLTDDRGIQGFKAYGGGPFGLYKALMIPNIVRIYEAAKKPVKKKAGTIKRR